MLAVVKKEEFMSKKKKIVIIIAAVVFVAIIAAVIIVVATKEKDGAGNGDSKVINIDEVSNQITQNSSFKEMATVDVTMDLIDTYFGINRENVVKAAGQIPSMNVHARMYIIIEAQEGKAEDVKAELNTYAENYEQMWSTYLPDQYELVKNRRLGSTGNYVYLIIAENAVELEELIK